MATLTTTSSNLKPVTGLRSTIYSKTAAELFWDRMPGHARQYRVYADGLELALTEGTSWFSDDLVPGSTTVMSVLAIAGSQESAGNSIILAMPQN